MSEGPTPEDALQVAQRSLAKVNENHQAIEELTRTIEYLEQRVVQLEARTSTDDADYANLSKNQKIGMVREELVRRAQDAASGWAKLDYSDIKWSVFDGHPSADHCYTLMALAAEAEGFVHRSPEGENEHVAVDLEQAKRGAAFSSAKNPAGEGGA